MNMPKKQIASLDGWFTMPPAKPQLIGSRCLACGDITFPKSDVCRNPHCRKEKPMETIHFGEKGKIFTYTVNYYKAPKPYHSPEPFVPYASAIIELPEGVMVQAMIGTGFNEHDLKIGMEMELVIDKLYDDENGNEVLSWMYRPIKKK